MLSGEGSGFDSEFLHNTSHLQVELIFCTSYVDVDIAFCSTRWCLRSGRPLELSYYAHMRSRLLTHSGPNSPVHPPPNRLPLSTHHRTAFAYQPREVIVRIHRRWSKVSVAHDILTQTIDTVLHVQLYNARRNLFHLLVVFLRLECPGCCLVVIHGRRNMHADRVDAVQSVEDFWP